MNKIGYARVSTEEQSLQSQMIALKNAGCVKIFTDQGVSGRQIERTGLSLAMEYLRAGDCLVVWRLDRLGRSLAHLLSLIQQFADTGIDFASLSECIDTKTSSGLLMFHMMAALAQFERSLIAERTKAGLLAARSRGAKLGRPTLLTPDMLGLAKTMLESASIDAVAQHVGVHPRTLQRKLKALAPTDTTESNQCRN